MAAQNKDYISQPPLKLGGHVTLFWPMRCELSAMCTLEGTVWMFHARHKHMSLHSYELLIVANYMELTLLERAILQQG